MFLICTNKEKAEELKDKGFKFISTDNMKGKEVWIFQAQPGMKVEENCFVSNKLRF